MPKEDRSDWVAVGPDASSAVQAQTIKPATSAFTYFQRDITEDVKRELRATDGTVKVAEFTKRVRDRWKNLDGDERGHYEELARQDAVRYNRESHAADVAAMERRERLQRERETVMLDDVGGTKRTTRGRRARQERKKEKAARKRKARTNLDGDEEEFDEDDDDEESSGSYEVESDEESSDSDDSEDEDDGHRKKKKKKKKAPPPKRQPTQKQMELRQKKMEEKREKESIIAERQENIRQEKATQAKRRLEFLLKQSNIFSHFGQVKQDQAKYGIKTTAKKDDSASNRRQSVEDEQTELTEVDTHQATYLSSQPTTLGFGQMRPYQLEGLNWMIRLQENGVNGILADEMGLGKTLQSISILVYMLEYQNCTGPHLVVVPKSTLSNWMNELARWAPTLKPVKFHGDKASRDTLANEVLCPGQRDSERQWHVCVTTYEVCNIEKHVLNKFAWSYLIIDEAHRLKNETSAFSATVRSFETRYRILITGTPLQNSLHELWALLNFLVPDVFASAEQFDEWFNLDIDDNDEKNRLISQLHKILRPFMLRRLKKEVETSLPPKHETILFTGMSVLQRKLYRDILVRDIEALQGKNAGNRTAILNIVMQLRKCAGHPYLFPGAEDRSLPPLGEHLVENCGKMVLLDKLLKRLKERGHRVLLFTQMTRILDIMEDYLVMRRFQYCRIDGNTSYEDREDFIDAYNAPNSEKFIFLLSTRAGGLGINLQTADVVILYDSDWNPQADLQAQDRAHRIGQKREVQVFRLVTEHTVEEKIVERAQQKLKLDAMVVQQGRLKEKDKLSRNELLEAVRFGADMIFKSKDSTITDEDIDLIIGAGRKKTQELNEKLKAADKGDLLDFKLDGNSKMQTFEGVDYSNGGALAAAKAEADILHIIDMGKRERRTVANYNENKLYQQQVAARQSAPVRKKKKVIKLPKSLRLPRMEECQMFNQKRLKEIEELEEKNFRALPEEVQKMAISKKESENKADGMEEVPSQPEIEQDPAATKAEDGTPIQVELPPLLDEETLNEKKILLSEGFVGWKRTDFSSFVKASARYGRTEYAKIAVDVGKTEEEVTEYAKAFWGDIGKERISGHEYERVVKLIEKGEKKISDMKSFERATETLISLFDNPWEELQFTHPHAKDKMFSVENDRYLLCLTHKYGFGQWGAIKMAIRRSTSFRFDYFLRSAPIDLIARRCEALMKLAEKEIDFLEKKAKEYEDTTMSDSPSKREDDDSRKVSLLSFSEMQRRTRQTERDKRMAKRKELEQNVEDIEAQMKAIQDRLKGVTPSVDIRPPSMTTSPRRSSSVSQDHDDSRPPAAHPLSRNNSTSSGRGRRSSSASQDHDEDDSGVGGIAGEDAGSSSAAAATTPVAVKQEDREGAAGPDGEFVPFPDYDSQFPPKEPRKAFVQFYHSIKKEIKASLDSESRQNKSMVHEISRERWLELSDEKKNEWRRWAVWDKKRYHHELSIYEKHQQQKEGGGDHNDGDAADTTGADGDNNNNTPTPVLATMHVPKKRPSNIDDNTSSTNNHLSGMAHVPKKNRRL